MQTTGGPIRDADDIVNEKRIIAPKPFPWLDYSRYSYSMGVEKGGILFISGQTASQYDSSLGRVVCRGGVVEQIGLVYEKIRLVLEAAGASFENVVKTVDYLTPRGLPDYRGTADVRREYFNGSWPASTGIVVEHLLRPDALIEVDAIAVLNVEKEAVNPGWSRYDRLTYHPAVQAGDLLCLSGFTGQRARPGSAMESSTGHGAEQTAAIYESIEAVLREAGASHGDLLKTVDYITPACLGGYDSTEEVRLQLYWDSLPASSGVVVNRLLREEALIEIETVAVLGGHRQEVRPAGWSHGYRRQSCPPAVKKGKFLFISGQTAHDYRTGSVVGEGDIVAQARQAYRNIQEVVEAAGGTMQDIVKTIEFITSDGLGNYRAVGDLRTKVFQRDFPAATGVVVNSLQRPGLLIQVDAIAILG